MTDPEQPENLERVSQKIARYILDFCRACIVSSQSEFRMRQLEDYVRMMVQVRIAPDSARRIFNDLRNKGRIGYTLLSRKDSHYRIDWIDVNPNAAPPAFDPFEDLA